MSSVFGGILSSVNHDNIGWSQPTLAETEQYNGVNQQVECETRQHAGKEWVFLHDPNLNDQ
jgi:hypothetical protein